MQPNPQAGPERERIGAEFMADGESESISEKEKARLERLNGLGLSLAKKRSEAIQARQSSGIETQWLEDEEFYQGIDDANRNEHTNAWRTKPPGTYTQTPKSVVRSTVFVNVTAPYCDAGAARFSDMVLPGDDKNYSIGPTPLPDLVNLAAGKHSASIMRSAAQAHDQAGMQKMLSDAQQQAEAMIDEAKAKAKKAEARIEDWHIECQYHAEVRKVVENSARIGTGILKGPIPKRIRTIAFEQPEIPEGMDAASPLANPDRECMLIIKMETKPVSISIDPWNFYPSAGCGPKIHNGDGTFERDYLSHRQLQELLGGNYIDGNIELCLEEGPMKAIAKQKDSPDMITAADDNRFEVWYYHGSINKDDMEAAGWAPSEGNKNHRIPAMVVMVNNRVIKAALNPLDTGDYPYDLFPWKARDNMPWGTGVARAGRTSQRIINGGVRHMMDNAGLAAGCQIVIKQGLITPADGNMDIQPRKVWYVGEDADIDDVSKAMHFFEIPMRQRELMEIVQYGMKSMEDATGLPMLLQGQQGKAPDTVGGMTMLNNNASAVLRRLARTFDDCLTEPHIRRYYAWLLQYGEDDEKGDFQINARGSSALVERDLQAQEISQMGAVVTNPVFGLDPKKWARELLKSRKFDPKSFEFDDEKWQKIVENMGQKPQDPRLQVEQLRGQTLEKLKTLDQQFAQQEADKDRNLTLLVEQVNERMEQMKLSGAKEISFDELKAMLAEKSMALATQRELSAASLAVDMHKHHIPGVELKMQALTPPTEPAGRAQPGQSFAQ